MKRTVITAAVATLALVGLSSTGSAQPRTVAGAACGPLAATGAQENATEPKSGRRFFIEYPCDLAADDKVTVILNLHGGGSSGSFQRRYFPAGDYADAYKLVVVTPTAATGPVRRWVGEADDQYLRDLTDLMFQSLGPQNVKAFWLAGHSQGGSTTQRIICTPFFRGKVDGFLSLSGGRMGGPATLGPNFFRAEQAPAGTRADPAVAPPRERAASAAAQATGPEGPLTCDYSHIFAIGQYEIVEMPEASALAQRFGCSGKARRPDVVDERAGYIYDPGQQNPATLGWGRQPRPGTSQVWAWEGCSDGRVVADVMRMDKGHTEGLEPCITEEIVRLITSASGGAAQRGS